MCVYDSCDNSQLIACFKAQNIENMMKFLHLISGTCAARIGQKIALEPEPVCWTSLPSGKRKQKTMENHQVQLVNPL